MMCFADGKEAGLSGKSRSMTLEKGRWDCAVAGTSRAANEGSWGRGLEWDEALRKHRRRRS